MRNSDPKLRRNRLPWSAVALLLSGTAAIATGRPVVVTSNTILADITMQVAGEAAEVRCLVPQGADLHGFEPRPGEVAALTRASLVVANGAGFEPWLDKLIESSRYRGPIVHAVDACQLFARGEEEEAHSGHHEHDDDHGHGAVDPHAWQDVGNGIRYAGAIRDGLIAIDPDSAAHYRERAARYIEELAGLDSWIRKLFAAIPAERRAIVTSHDALAYFGRAYGVRILPLRGLDTRQEPDARAVAALVDALRAQKVRAIFVETVSNPKMLEQLARDTGVLMGGELFTDSVGEPGTAAEGYAGMMRENARRIAAALTGE